MLRPDDIRSTTFKKGLFGYKAADVDSHKGNGRYQTEII